MMSAESSIKTYSDAALQGAHDDMARNSRSGMMWSWEGQRLRLLAMELRIRKLAKEKERRAA